MPTKQPESQPAAEPILPAGTIVADEHDAAVMHEPVAEASPVGQAPAVPVRIAPDSAL